MTFLLKELASYKDPLRALRMAHESKKKLFCVYQTRRAHWNYKICHASHLSGKFGQTEDLDWLMIKTLAQWHTAKIWKYQPTWSQTLYFAFLYIRVQRCFQYQPIPVFNLLQVSFKMDFKSSLIQNDFKSCWFHLLPLTKQKRYGHMYAITWAYLAVLHDKTNQNNVILNLGGRRKYI